MTYTYTIPANILSILQEMDYLGFSSAGDAMNAILSHHDWEERWDVAYQTQFIEGQPPQLIEFIPAHKIEEVRNFRRSIINQVRSSRASWFACAEDPDDYELDEL